MAKLFLTLAAIVVLGGGGYYVYQQSNASMVLSGDEKMADMGTYQYACDEHVMLNVKIAADAQSLTVEGVGEGKYPGLTTLTRVGTSNRFEGGDIVLVGNGETITLNPEGEATINCSPEPNPEMAPWNFGDGEMEGGAMMEGSTSMSAEVGSVKPDVWVVVGESIMGKWRANDDKKFVREFKEGDVVVDWYDNEVVSEGKFVVFTKANAPKMVAFPILDNAVYIQSTMTGSQADTLNYKVTLSADANTLTLTYMDRGGATTYTRVK